MAMAPVSSDRTSAREAECCLYSADEVVFGNACLMSAVYDVVKARIRRDLQRSGAAAKPHCSPVCTLDCADKKRRGGKHAVGIGHRVRVVDASFTLSQNGELGPEEPGIA